MNVHEPMTVVTDYILAVAATTFGVGLLRAGNRIWALAFFATAAASFLGGTYHGLAHQPLWKPTVYSIGLASMFLLAGLGRVFAVAAVVKFVVYAVWMATHDEFVYVIVDYGITLLLVGAFAAVRWLRARAPFAPWVLGSIVVSVAAAAVQQSAMSLHRHFNHNDLYHVIQVGGLWLLYRGGLLLTTWSTDRSTSRPT